jgi:hypothetical protein
VEKEDVRVREKLRVVGEQKGGATGTRTDRRSMNPTLFLPVALKRKARKVMQEHSPGTLGTVDLNPDGDDLLLQVRWSYVVEGTCGTY